MKEKHTDKMLILPRKDSYARDIKNWLDAYKPYMEDFKLKDLAELSYKKLKERLSHIYDDDGNIVISQSNKIFDLTLYYDDPDTYYFDVMNLIRALRYDMQHTETYYEFKYPSGEITRISCIHYLFNMIIWMPLFVLGIRITPDFLFAPKEFTNKTYINYLNTKIIEPYKHMVTMNEMSNILARMYDLFIRISEKCSLYLGLSFSLYDIVKRWDNNSELYDINHTIVPPDMSTAEGEAMLNAKSQRFQEIMLYEEPDNQIKPLLAAGQANPKQLKEFGVNISYKPDLEGRTLNTHPRTNFISDGLRDPVDYVTDASGGRKASNLALQIDDSGYLQRTLCKSAADLILHDDPTYDCGSTHYYIRTINSKKDLEDMRGRWYVHGKKLRQLIETDYELIGQTLKFRSPATCASKKGICSTCYGYLYSQNKGINIGINSGLKLTERFYQNTMSAKHILNTSTTALEFDDEFYNYFATEDGYRIRVREDLDYAENYDLRININEIARDKEIENMPKNEHILGFVVYDKEAEEEIRLDEKKFNPVYFADFLFDIIVDKRSHGKYDEDGWVSIPLEDLMVDEDIFFVQFTNNEITKPLKELKSMIEKGKEIEGITTISELINRLNQLMKDGGIFTESVHVEIITRNLIRDRNNPTKLPDYTKDIDPIFISIHNSILNSNSVITGFTFERLHQQLRSPDTYNKTGVSPYDRLFIGE